MPRLVVIELQIKEKQAGTFHPLPLQPIFYQHSPARIGLGNDKKWISDVRLRPLLNSAFFQKENFFMSHNFMLTSR